MYLLKLRGLYDFIRKAKEASVYKSINLLSEIWNRFIENNQNCYKSSAIYIIHAKIYTDKFGIKFCLASDVNRKYDKRTKYSIPLGEFIVLHLMKQFTECGRNVTTDNFFTKTSVKINKNYLNLPSKTTEREYDTLFKQTV
ncbi:piggyBac transposable element-derived protein 4-like [Vespula squamosa]|uniref:PiggyBac transposable element-derived protein 4-like n=1 Tax=Vespula squamosa TaxID=30214 RepID=A0ABD2A168_VESSQ